MTDHINPNHYKGVLVIPAARVNEFRDPVTGDISLQYIEVMEFTLTKEEYIGHLKGQYFKYLLRLGKKDDRVQELSKAEWYVNRLKKFFTGE
jgi:hypothetical protein